MGLKASAEGLGKLFGISIVAAALAGCGGASSSSSGNAGSTTSSTSASSSSTTSNTANPSVALSSSYYAVTPASSAIVTVYRIGSSAGAATVGYSTINGTAMAGTDYVATSGSVTWQDGDTSAKDVIVPVASSASGKAFAIALMSIQGSAQLGTPAAATIQVANSSGGGSSSSGTTTATLSWSAPTENTNGTALTNLAGYNIYYGNSASAMTNRVTINSVGILTYVIDNLNPGDWYFALTSVNSAGVESVLSNTVQTTL